MVKRESRCQCSLPAEEVGVLVFGGQRRTTGCVSSGRVLYWSGVGHRRVESVQRFRRSVNDPQAEPMRPKRSGAGRLGRIGVLSASRLCSAAAGSERAGRTGGQGLRGSQGLRTDDSSWRHRGRGQASLAPALQSSSPPRQINGPPMSAAAGGALNYWWPCTVPLQCTGGKARSSPASYARTHGARTLSRTHAFSQRWRGWPRPPA